MHADVNLSKPATYYDYEAFEPTWRGQDDYEVVRKVGRGKYSEVFEVGALNVIWCYTWQQYTIISHQFQVSGCSAAMDTLVLDGDAACISSAAWTAQDVPARSEVVFACSMSASMLCSGT